MKEFNYKNKVIEVCIYRTEKIKDGFYKLRVTAKTDMDVGDRIINVISSKRAVSDYELTNIELKEKSKGRWLKGVRIVGEFKVVRHEQ